MERAFHLPRGSAFRSHARAFGASSLSVAELSAGQMREVLAHLREPPVGTRIERAERIARAARRFLDPNDDARLRALAALPPITGFSAPMIAETLPRTFAPLADSQALVAAAQSAETTFDLVGIVAAGNVPGVALPKAALALVAGAACFVKLAAGEPLLAALFGEVLTAVDPTLGARLAVAWWEGGTASGERTFLEEVDSLVAYGSDATIAALAARTRVPLVAHGHKLSVAVAKLDGELAPLAARTALDVALYDQLGCLSPHALYTIGDDDRRAAFLGELATAFEDAERRWPRGHVPEEHALAIHRLRDESEWRAIGGESVSVRSGAGFGWTLVDEPRPILRPSPLYRTLFVHRLSEVGELGRAVGEWLPHVESVGMGPWPDPQAGKTIAMLGIPRVAPLGEMQSPDLGWRQGGRDPMAGIARDSRR